MSPFHENYHFEMNIQRAILPVFNSIILVYLRFVKAKFEIFFYYSRERGIYTQICLLVLSAGSDRTISDLCGSDLVEDTGQSFRLILARVELYFILSRVVFDFAGPLPLVNPLNEDVGDIFSRSGC